MVEILHYTAVLPLRTQISYADKNLRNDYKNPLGQLDVGKFFKFLDSSAGAVAWEQANGPVVTAALEGASIQKPLTLDYNYELNLYVTKTWSKSLEVSVEVSGNNGRERVKLVEFYFTFVGVDDNGKPREIPHDAPRVTDEQRRAEDAQNRKDSYIASKTSPLSIDAIAAEEHIAVSRLQEGYRSKGYGVPVSDTTASSLDLMVARNQNVHGKIFGGYILEQIFNEAWKHAYAFCGDVLPLVAAINRVDFLAPVETNDILTYSTRTIYAHKTSLVQEVVAQAKNSETGIARVVTKALCTLVAADKERKPTPLASHVVPLSDEEVIQWVLADRRRKSAVNNKE